MEIKIKDEIKIENGILKRYFAGSDATAFTIPDDVQEIDDWAMNTHSRMTMISIPETVMKIGDYSFSNCSNLKSFHVAESNPYYADIDGILYNREKDTLLCCPSGRERIHLPANVTRIKENDAFTNCQHLKEITVDQHHPKFKLLNGVLYEHDQDIPVKLIRCPVDIPEVQIPETVREISPSAFESCSELKEIIIPERVTEIQQHTFHQCDQLKDVHLHSGITHIRKSAFQACNSLEEMIIPYGVQEIEDHAFSFCYQLEKLVIPESVISFGMLFMCPKLRTITCHHIPVPHQQYGDINKCIRMIIQKALHETVLPVIKYTILYLMFLKNPEDQEIKTHIRNHFKEIITEFIPAGELKMIRHYLESFQEFLTAQYLDEFIRLAIDQQKYEIQVFLTNLKYQRNDFTPKDWSL